MWLNNRMMTTSRAGYCVVLLFLISSVLAACKSNHEVTAESLDRSHSIDAIRFASFNIHYIAAGQKKLDWDSRKHAVVKSLREIDADVIAFQEMETFAGGSFNRENRQLDWITQHFPQYRAGAFGDASVYPGTQPILYRHERFEQLDQGFFFFSDTPEVIYSRTFNGSWPAFCSWSLLKDKQTGESFTVFNVHFEYKSMSNRSKSAKLVSERIRPLVADGQSVVLLGDTNAPGFTPTMRTLKNIPLQLAPSAGATFHLNRGWHLIPAIDHVLYSSPFKQLGRTRLWRNNYDGVWPTDHYPVSVDLIVPG